MSKIISKNINANVESGLKTDVAFNNGQLQLSISGTVDASNMYSGYGVYETPVLDTTKFSKKLKSLNITSEIPNGTSIVVSTSTSNDGMNFESYVALNGDNTIASSNGQYIKIKVEFNSKLETVIRTLNDFVTGESSQFNQDSQIIFDGNMTLNNVYQSTMTKDSSFTDEGMLFKKSINKSNFNKIDKVEVI